MSDPVPADLAAALHATAGRRGVFGEPLVFFTEASSTNDLAASLAERGAPEGTTVVALSQTAGRGRFGRDWFSPHDAGLYASIVCRNRIAAPYLTLAGGVAVADGIRRATGLPVAIKWPNDIVVHDGTVPARRRKLAGLLAEASSGADGLQYVVLGIGVNLRPAAYPVAIADRASSLESELGRHADGWLVLSEILAGLAELTARLASGEAGAVLDRWRALSPSAQGTTIGWDTPAGRMTGVSAGVADDGALLVRVGDRIERIVAGELQWG